MESERAALLDFKKGLIDHSNRLSSWTGKNCCKWEGIGCNMHFGRVVMLRLRNPVIFDVERYYFDHNYRSHYDNLSLGGEISPSLLQLKYLQHLDLSQNNFSGIRIPSFLGSFKYMRYLNLSKARFHGEIPSHLGNMSRLQYLDLDTSIYDFPLSAKSLWWVTRLSSLKSLDLSGTLLREANDWSEAIFMLPSLLYLNLEFCSLSEIPSALSITNATSIVSLNLKWNFFATSFPLWLFNLSSVEDLNFQRSWFEGKLPNMFEKLSSLTKLDISGNFFNSSFPNSLCTLTSLTHVDASLNSFRGKLPFCLENLTSLSLLQLRENEFQNTIPFQIGHLGKLIQLDLSHNELEGTIPSSLGQLARLERLQISYNKLSGTIPSSFGQLAKLERLQISFNKLSGSIPSSLGQLEKLQYMDISHNSFAGELTELHFAKLSELKSLIISPNFLRLNISSHWLPPFQLVKIYMDGVQVGPQFPPWLETQRRVSRLRMRNASISDTIPSWFEVVYSHITFLDLSHNQLRGKPPQIEGKRQQDRPLAHWFWYTDRPLDPSRQIDLSFNKFEGTLKSIPRYADSFIVSSNSLTGQIPPFDGNGTTTPLHLQNLILNDNGFTGNIPSTICNLKHLEILDLSNNHLSGEIPFCFGNLQSLWLLNLANNRLFGQIPSSFGNLGSLQILLLNENKIQGELPSSLQNLTSLEVIDIGENGLSSTLPRWLGKETLNLRWLRLQSNHFYGDIPLEICQLLSLQILNLAQNNFTGIIPRCFGNFTAMRRSESLGDIGVDPRRSRGPIGPLDEIENRPFLSNLMKGLKLEYSLRYKSFPKSIELSGNKIVGEIPKELMNLIGLQSLDLSKNLLHGRIPENIGNLKELESLDLSMNELSGSIPPSLATIDTLGYLNLSYNSLSGQIPQGDHFQTFDNKSIYEGNIGLCGKPVSDNCGTDDSPSKKDGFVDFHHGESFDIPWFYAGIGPGFGVGFAGVFTVLWLKKSWQDAYFRFVENLCSRLWI